MLEVGHYKDQETPMSQEARRVAFGPEQSQEGLWPTLRSAVGQQNGFPSSSPSSDLPGSPGDQLEPCRWTSWQSSVTWVWQSQVPGTQAQMGTLAAVLFHCVFCSEGHLLQAC